MFPPWADNGFALRTNGSQLYLRGSVAGCVGVHTTVYLLRYLSLDASRLATATGSRKKHVQ